MMQIIAENLCETPSGIEMFGLGKDHSRLFPWVFGFSIIIMMRHSEDKQEIRVQLPEIKGVPESLVVVG
jgi:hypothetical protein